MPLRRPLPLAACLIAAAVLAACAAAPDEPPATARQETVFAVTAGNTLVKFNAGQPQQILASLPVQGLAAGDRLVGIDYRVARGVLYALSAGGRLYTLDTTSGRLSPVGQGAPLGLNGEATGFDFNPAADRIRVVTSSGQNFRLHPDTGALAASDPTVAYAAGDSHAGKAPDLAAAGYTYNKTSDKLTTNYAIDRADGSLVRQGSVEGAQPVVSPNTGQLFTVGPLGTGAVDDVAFDIADTNNAALAALRKDGRTRLFDVDLATGRARLLGTVGNGQPLVGMAIEP